VSDLVPLGRHMVTATPLRGGRRDVTVATPAEPQSFTQTDIVRQLRSFFSALEQEAQTHIDDPIALGHALARLDALLADLRYARDSVREMTAHALKAQKIRRLVIETIATLEAASEVKRTAWEHDRLMTDALEARGIVAVDTTTGERLDSSQLAGVLLAWFRPEWRMAAVRELGLDPDHYCSVATDDDGKTISTPTVRMAGNSVRD